MGRSMAGGDAYSKMDPAVLRRLEEIKVKGGLPAPKGGAMAIIRLAQRESTSLPVRAHAIKADPTFSVRLIKVACGVNDGYGPVVSVRDAVTVLGMRAVRSLTLGFSLLPNCRSEAASAATLTMSDSGHIRWLYLHACGRAWKGPLTAGESL